MQFRFTLTAAAALFALAAPARAEVIQLIDNTQVSGKIVHFYDGTFAVETSDGQKVELPTAKIKTITFKLPPARAEFSTPEKTFARYKDALVKNDITKLIDCYALMYQGVMAAAARSHQRRAAEEDAERNSRHQARDQVVEDRRQQRHLEGPARQRRRSGDRRRAFGPREWRVEAHPVGHAPTR